MKKIIGNIAIILILIILGGYFFRNTFIEYFGEKIGSQKYKAKIDIDEVDLNLFSGNIKIGRIQITDKNNTMRNIMDFKKINLKIEYKPLFKKIIVVDDATVGLVEILTPRKTDGFLIENIKDLKNIEIKKNKQLKLSNLNIDLNGDNYKKNINNLNLKIIKEYESEKEKIKNINTYWDTKLKGIDYKVRLKNIETKYKLIETKIKNEKNPLKILNELDELNDLAKEINLLVKEVENDKKQFTQDIKSLKGIQANAFEYIDRDDPFKEIVVWDKIALQSKINLILNNYLNKYIDKNIDFFNSFNKQDKIPQEDTYDFWIKNTNLTFQHFNYTFKGQIKDLTSKIDITSNPIRFNLDANNKFIKGDLHGELDRKTDTGKIKLNISGLTIDNKMIGENKNLIIIVGSKANLSYNMNYENKILNLDGQIILENLNVDPDKLELDLPIKKIIGESLKKINLLILNYNYDGLKKKLIFNTNIETILSDLIKDILDENKSIYKEKAKLIVDKEIIRYRKELNIEIKKIEEFQKIIGENSKTLKSFEKKIELNNDLKDKKNILNGLGDNLKNIFN